MESIFYRDSRTEKPAEVRTAIKILYASVGIGTLNSITDFLFGNVYPELLPVSGEASLFIGIGIIIFALAIQLFFIVKISSGYNWARITFLVLYLLGFLLFLLSAPNFTEQFKRKPLAGGISLFLTVLDLIALVLLFLRASNAWFRGQKNLSITD